MSGSRIGLLNLQNIKENRNIYVLGAIFIVQFIFFSFATSDFLSVANFTNVMRQSAELGMVCILLAIILMTGNIDLSIGAVMGVCAISLAKMLKAGMSIPLAILLSVVIGAFIGCLNGFIVARLHLAGIVATLGTQVLFRGICYVLTGGAPVSGLPKEFTDFAKVRILGIPFSFVLMIILFVIATIIMERTSFGVKIHAIGYNATATRYSGINSDLIKFWLFVVSGCMAAIAGMFMLMRFSSAESAFATSYDTSSLTALLLGGIDIGGGKGTMIGGFLGLITIAILKNGLNHMGVQSIVQNFILGLLIIVTAIRRKEKN